MVHFFQQVVAELERSPRFALGIISRVKGSSPQKQGAKALFFPDDRMLGTLGGGCLEAEIRRRARLALVSGKPETFDLTLDHDFGWDDGLICGGTVFGLILPQAAEAARDLVRPDAARSNPHLGRARGLFHRLGRRAGRRRRLALSRNRFAAAGALDRRFGAHRPSRRAPGAVAGL